MDHSARGESAVRRGILALALAALSAGLAAPCPAESPEGAAADGTSASAPGAATAPAPAARPAPATAPARGLFARSRPADTLAKRPGDGLGLLGSEAIWRMLASMLVITVLGIACYVVIKRVVPRIARPAGRNVRVLDTACLDRDKRIHVLGVGTEKFLVASGRGGVTMLADVTRALAGEEGAIPEGRIPPETSGGKASGS